MMWIFTIIVALVCLPSSVAFWKHKENEVRSIFILVHHFMMEMWTVLKLVTVLGFINIPIFFSNYISTIGYIGFIQQRHTEITHNMQEAMKRSLRYFVRILHVIFCKILEMWSFSDVKHGKVHLGLNIWPSDLPLTTGEDFPEERQRGLDPVYAEQYTQ